jgi:hypothetical protein
LSTDVRELLRSTTPNDVDHIDIDGLVRAGRRRRRAKRAGGGLSLVLAAVVGAVVLWPSQLPVGVVGTPGEVTARWERLPPAPIGARRGPTTLTDDGRVVGFGGFVDRGDESIYQLDGAIYLPDGNRWEPIPAAPIEPRVNPEVRLAGGRLLVFGGDGSTDDGASLDPAGPVTVGGQTIWLQSFRLDGAIYDLHERTWTVLPALDGQWYGPPTVVSWDGEELVVFDNGELDGPLRSMRGMVVGFDGGRTEISPPPLDRRSGSFDAWDGDRLVVWGGQRSAEQVGGTPGRVLSDGAVWDRRTGQWQPTASGPLSARAFSSFVRPLVVDGRALLIGGSAACPGCDDGTLTDGAWYDLDADLWEPYDPAGIGNTDSLIWDSWVLDSAFATVGYVGRSDVTIVAVVDRSGQAVRTQPHTVGMLVSADAVMFDPAQWQHFPETSDAFHRGLEFAVRTPDGWMTTSPPDTHRSLPGVAQLADGGLFVWGGQNYRYSTSSDEVTWGSPSDSGWRLHLGQP